MKRKKKPHPNRLCHPPTSKAITPITCICICVVFICICLGKANNKPHPNRAVPPTSEAITPNTGSEANPLSRLPHPNCTMHSPNLVICSLHWALCTMHYALNNIYCHIPNALCLPQIWSYDALYAVHYALSSICNCVYKESYCNTLHQNKVIHCMWHCKRTIQSHYAFSKSGAFSVAQ